MTKADGSFQLDAYLAQLRRDLRGLSPEEAEETIRELRSHVLDRADAELSPGSVAAALAALGDPTALARLNAAARTAARGAGRRSPWGLLGAIAQVARISLGGAWALLISLAGYALAASWILTAIAKPFAPDHVGLWRLSDAADDLTFSLGRTTNLHGHELLGWWIIPLGLLIGLLIGYATYGFGRWSLRRLARPTRSLPAEP